MEQFMQPILICSSLLGTGCIYQMLHLTSYAFASPMTSIKPSLLQFISGLLHLNGVSASPMSQTLQNHLKRYPILSKLVCISFPINSSFSWLPNNRITRPLLWFVSSCNVSMLILLYCLQLWLALGSFGHATAWLSHQ